MAAASKKTTGKPKPLADFDGKPVTKASIAVVGAGDGLSKAMKVQPVEYHTGEIVHVVIECRVGPVTFDEVEKGDATEFVRQHKFKAGLATVVNPDLVAEVLSTQQRLNEEHEGVHQLPVGDRPDDVPIEEWLASGGTDEDESN